MKTKKKAKKRPVASRSKDSSKLVDSLRRQIAQLRQEHRINQLKLKVFKEIGKISHAGVHLDHLLEHTMDFALQALHTDAGTLFTVDYERKELIFQVVKGPASIAKKLKGQRLAWGEGIVGHVVATGKPYVTHDVGRDKHWQKRFSEASGYSTKDMLCVPLRSSFGKVQGAIQVLNHKNAGKYTADDLEVLISIADQIAIVMENASLFYSLQGRMSDLESLHGISALLTSSLDRIEVRRSALEAVVNLMNCETGSLYQIDREKKELYFDVVLSDRDEVVKKIRLKIGEGIAGWVAQHRKGVVVADCAKDERFTRKVDKASQFITRNMICAPLIFKNEVLGVLQAINRKKGTFHEDDLLVFTDLANQVAIALKNAMLFEELRRTFYESVTALSEAIELRDPYTGGHTQRVKKYSLAIGKHMDLSPEQMENLSLSAILHDIGKIGVADQILRKQGKLDNLEFQEMKKHPEYGYNMLVHFPSLAMSYDGVLYHHERYDGKGYPKGLKGEEIPLFARIIAVADTFDAMTTNRPYRDGLSMDFVLKELRNCAGSQFDKRVVSAFLKAFEKNEIISS